MKVGNGNIPLRIGNLINTVVHGGPYRQIPDNMFGVKMAAEINMPCDVSIPTEDFCVPEVSDLQAGVVRALMAMINGHEVYAGCMGGIGRTGLFLAALAKVQIEYRRSKHRAGRGEDPVGYVRKHFIPHAVETQEQKQYIADFDVADIVNWLDVTQQAMGLNRGFQKKQSLEYTGPKTAIYEPHEDIPPDLADHVILDPSLVERDLDFIDAIEPDSAADVEDLPAPTWEQFDSLQNQIDEIQFQVDKQDDRITGTIALIVALRKELTNASWFSKLKAKFK